MIKFVSDKESGQPPENASLVPRHFLSQIQATAIDQHSNPISKASRLTRSHATHKQRAQQQQLCAQLTHAIYALMSLAMQTRLTTHAITHCKPHQHMENMAPSSTNLQLQASSKLLPFAPLARMHT